MYDGFAGPTCEIRTQQVCVNQCNGHGDCNQGFCKCHDGWYGHDCAFSRAGVTRTPGEHVFRFGRSMCQAIASIQSIY
jgi:hypothetical protein